MDLETLQHANFAKFSESVDDWKLLLRNLKGLQSDAEDGLEKAAQKADWEGLNSQVTKKFVTKTAAEFTDAHTEAQTIYNILNDTLGELKGFHRELNTAIERGRGKSLTVIAYDGGFTVTSNVPPEARAAMDKENADEITALRDDLQRIVNRATESDKGAARALDLVINQAQHGFSDVTAKDRDSAVEAIDEARKIEKIMKKDPDDVTNTELARLNASMAKYKDNPFYADTLASEVGAKRTLDFYTAVNDDSQFRVHPRSGKGLSEEQKERKKKLLRGLEKNLGTTLGTASHSDSPGMRAWKSDMTAIGSTYEPPVDGYRAMSNLMRNGHYETDFLLDYGDSMITYEKENKQDHYGGLQRDKTADDVLPWDENDGHARTRYGVDNDAGKDPMTGFMEALGHNSEASTAVFKDDKQFDYLTEGRKWPEDHSSQDTKGGTAGYNSLGHALESATKGAPYDADPPRLQRDADTAAVAEKVVERYGQDPEYNKDHKQTGLSGAQLMDKQAGIGDSIGSIGAAYIDDINWSMDGNADKSLFAMDDGGRGSQGERAHFEAGTVSKFLSSVGQDPQGYAQVSTAQQAYTTSLIEAHPPTPAPNGQADDVEAVTAVRTGANVHGILDHARVEEIKAEGRTADEKYNDAIDDRTERNKMIAGIAVGGATGIIPSPTSGVAATVIPIVADGVEGTATGLIERNLDQYGKSQHRDNSEEWHDDGRHVYEKGYQAAWAPGMSVLERADDNANWQSKNYVVLSDDLKTAYQTGYNTGSRTDQQVGMLPTPQK